VRGRHPAPVAAAAVGLLVLLSGCGQQASAPPAPVEPDASSSEASKGLDVSASKFQLQYRLDGVVAPGTQVRADVPVGMMFTPQVKSGDPMAVGDILGTLVAEEWGGPEPGTVERSRRLLVSEREREVRAPVAGVVRVSSRSISIQRPGMDVVVPLKPLQELRYRGTEFSASATVETVLGQRTVPCQALWIERLDTAVNAADQVDGGQAASAAIHCRLSDSVETAPGLPAVAHLTSSAIEDTIAVPVVYVGLDKDGKNYLVKVRDADKEEQRAVVVGPTDGVRRVILEGLDEGETIVPVEAP
jgi:hypothetical protein